jgi:uncharacterized protein (TIGR00288 family)
VSPWWLRPPGEEPDEAPDAAPRPPRDEAAEPASIADLMKLHPAEPARESEPAESEDDDNDAEENGEAETAPEAPGEGEEAPRRRRRRRRRRRGGAPSAEGEGAKAGAAAVDDEDDDEEDERDDYESVARDILESLPVSAGRRQSTEPEERKIALFCDLENVALGVRDSEVKRFDIQLVLERLLEKGKIIVKRAYADWERYSEFKVGFHEAAIELIDIPQRRYTGKNSADIKMVVDAMDLCYAKEHLDTFVVLSGDSDFSPLVSKLKENNKYVIGIGVKNSSSNLLVDNCDEFIYYEDVWRDRVKGPELTGLTKKKAEVFSLLTDSVLALQRENKDVLWGSLIKQTMQRKKPSFNEGYYGYSTFTELLQDAERHQIVKLKREQRSGTLVVTGFAKRNK